MRGKISNFELFSVTIAGVMGVGILSLPRRAEEGAGVDGIISVLLAGVIFTVVTVMYSKLIKKYPTKTFFEFGENLVGKYVIKVLVLLFSLHFLLIMSTQVRQIAETLKQFLLFNTPLEVIMISMILVSALAVSTGLLIISRISSLYVPLTILGLIIVLGLSLRTFEIESLYNLFTNSTWKIVRTAIKLSSDFVGFGVILFIVPLLAKPKSVVKISAFSMLTVTLLYFLTTVASFGQFRIVPNQYVIQPTAILSKTVFIQGFAERIDIIFMIFWILAAFMSITIKWYISAYSMSKIVSLKNYIVFTFLSLPLVYVLTLIPQNANQTQKATELSIYSAWLVVILTVFIFYIISFFKKGGQKNNEPT